MARRKNRIPVENVLHGNLLLLVLEREYTPNSVPCHVFWGHRACATEWTADGVPVSGVRRCRRMVCSERNPGRKEECVQNVQENWVRNRAFVNLGASTSRHTSKFEAPSIAQNPRCPCARNRSVYRR